MQNISIEKTDNSPKVIMNVQTGVIEIEGNSYPENTFEFYKLFIECLTSYFELYEKEKTIINFKLKYFNSATSQTLFNIFDIIQDKKTNQVEINWYYDLNDENALNDYEDFNEEFEQLNIQAIAFDSNI